MLVSCVLPLTRSKNRLLNKSIPLNELSTCMFDGNMRFA